MTRSEDVQCRAARLLEQLIALLGEEQIARLIDEPVDRALLSFECGGGVGYSADLFHKVVADFVRHVYATALPGRPRLSLSRAQDEAIALLERTYEGTCANGYYAAVLDAADSSQQGLSMVLARLAESIKAHRRQMYLRWVGVRHIDPADWPTKCAMAAILIGRGRSWMPPRLHRCPPEQLADNVLDLLCIDLTTNGQLPSAPFR